MASPFLNSPHHWFHGTLQADPGSELIVQVDSGGTPSTADEDNWDGDIP